MKLVLMLAAVVAVAVARPDSEYYESRYDDFNAQELVENVRLLKSYAKCFLDKGPCTAEGAEFKKIIPEALRTKCAKCSPKQRVLIRTVVKGFQAKVPELWEELVHKEDPKNEFQEDIKKFLNDSD